MNNMLTRNWWLYAVRGVLGIIFGILALVWPEQTILALVLLFGAYALVDALMISSSPKSGQLNMKACLGYQDKP